MTQADLRVDLPRSSRRTTRARWATLWRASRTETLCFAALLFGLAAVPFWLGSNRLLAWGLNATWFCTLAILYEVLMLAGGRRHAVGIRHVLLPAGLFLTVVFWIVIQIGTWV